VEEEGKLGVAPCRDVFRRDPLRMRRRVLLGVALMGLQQWCGINAVMLYPPDSLNQFCSENASIIRAFVLSLRIFLATFITVFTIDPLGRTKLLVVVLAGLFVIGFAFSGWGVPSCGYWSEQCFRTRTRGKAAGLMVMSNWIFTTCTNGISGGVLFLFCHCYFGGRYHSVLVSSGTHG